MLTVGSLFAGIGGFDLGFERAGMRTSWFCEIDPFCQQVLAKHWPDVPCYSDITELTAGDVKPVDVLCGGFPCQDISLAGKGAGITGTRSGLWSEYARLVNELRPRYVVVENVPALKTRGLEVVLADLMACGYDAEWDCLPACAFGAPHRRDRIWIVAYQQGLSQRLADSNGERGTVGGEARNMARSPRAPEGDGEQWQWSGDATNHSRADISDSDEQPQNGLAIAWSERGHWTVEPNVGRVADGVPRRVDRLRSLGNSLVPQIAQFIGERIVSLDDQG